MITEKSDIKYMAEKILTINELKILARNPGINIISYKLIQTILPVKAFKGNNSTYFQTL